MRKKFFRGFLVLALVAMTYVPAFATNWVRIGNGHYIDSDSIRPSNNYGTYTMRTKYNASCTTLEVINGNDVLTIKTNTYLYCNYFLFRL